MLTHRLSLQKNDKNVSPDGDATTNQTINQDYLSEAYRQRPKLTDHEARMYYKLPQKFKEMVKKDNA